MRKTPKKVLNNPLNTLTENINFCRIGDDKCTILRISGPLKQLYADNHNLQWEELMSDGPYKEQHRLDMINWSDSVRAENPGYFCQAACKAGKYCCNHQLNLI